jgi:hypothetical protein
VWSLSTKGRGTIGICSADVYRLTPQRVSALAAEGSSFFVAEGSGVKLDAVDGAVEGPFAGSFVADHHRIRDIPVGKRPVVGGEFVHQGAAYEDIDLVSSESDDDSLLISAGEDAGHLDLVCCFETRGARADIDVECVALLTEVEVHLIALETDRGVDDASRPVWSESLLDATATTVNVASLAASHQMAGAGTG